MPKLKQPRSLQILAIERLGTSVLRASQKAIDAATPWRYSPWRVLAALGIGFGKTPEINTSDLNQYLYGDLPHLLSCEVTEHVLSAVTSLLELPNNVTYDDCGNTDVKSIIERLILACVYPHITALKMCGLPKYVQRILFCNIHTFERLHKLRLPTSLPTDVIETLPMGLSALNFLVDFSMICTCTDAIINTLGSRCSTTIEHIEVNGSLNVTDESFKNFIKCIKLKSILILNTSVTAEGYLQYLKNIRQRKKPGDKAKGLLRIDLGSFQNWYVSTRQLDEVASSCPMLKQIEICELRGDLESLVSLTTLEVLQVEWCRFNQCNFDGFLRVSGCNIISLEFRDTYSIDLTCIMNNCINIKKLCVLVGSIVVTENTVNVTKACQNLEILHLRCEFSASSIEPVLYACVNLTRLHLGTLIEDITDEFILRLLSNNPLRDLTSFTAVAFELIASNENEGSPGLTMESVNAVIEHCPLLEELEFHNCYKVTDTEIKCLKQKIKDNNQDLAVNFSF